MAFYTSRVDDSGVELERRHSARSIATTISENSSRMESSSRSSCKGSIRIVNRAAFIEKTPDLSEVSSISDEKDNLTSECQSDIVPPLDLQSEENYPTTRDYTFSYRKECEANKIVLKPDRAYETWLSAKRKLHSDEATRRKKAEELKQQEQEARKRLSKEKLKSWLENKAIQQNRSREKLKSADAAEEKAPKPANGLESQAKIEEWDRIKRLEDERRRVLKRQEEEQRRKTENLRRQQADKAWEGWLAAAANKPKPVPLNQGIFTLRGTISDIYVNPNEWKTPIDEPIQKN